MIYFYPLSRATQTVSEVWSSSDCSTPTLTQFYTRKVRQTLEIPCVSADILSLTSGPDLTWRQYMCHVCNQSDSLFYDNLRDILMDRLESEKIVKTIENLGLLSDQPIKKKGSPIDTVSYSIFLKTKIALFCPTNTKMS